MGKWRRCEDDMDRVAEIKALRVPFLLHVLPFHLIGSLGSFCFWFFFLICSSVYQRPGKKKKGKMGVLKVLCV